MTAQTELAQAKSRSDEVEHERASLASDLAVERKWRIEWRDARATTAELGVGLNGDVESLVAALEERVRSEREAREKILLLEEQVGD